jgi:hypothetical protein
VNQRNINGHLVFLHHFGNMLFVTCYLWDAIKTYVLLMNILKELFWIRFDKRVVYNEMNTTYITKWLTNSLLLNVVIEIWDSWQFRYWTVKVTIWETFKLMIWDNKFSVDIKVESLMSPQMSDVNHVFAPQHVTIVFMAV